MAYYKSTRFFRLSKFKTSCGCFLLVCFLLVMNNVEASDHYQVVIHPDVKEENISVNVLRAIFSMRLRTWPNGEMVRVFVLPDDHELHHDFAKERLSVFPYQLRLAWDRLVFSGTGQAPVRVHSHDEMLAKIASTPGAIGYLETPLINGNVHVLNIR